MNLYFAGGRLPKGAEEKLRLGGYNRLYSQFNDRTAIGEYLEERNGLLLIDSGAFTAHRKNVEIDVDEYIQWANANTEKIDYFIQLDQIPGRFGHVKTRQEYHEAAIASYKNFEYMVTRVHEPHKLMPVFHYGDDFNLLTKILNHKLPNGGPVEYMGISPANDTGVKVKSKWIDKVFAEIKRCGREDIKTHALGMTSFAVLEQYPFTSADSTSWLLTAAYGGIMTPYGIVDISERRTDAKDHIFHQKEKGLEVIEEYVAKQGFDMNDLATNARYRALLNAKYCREWAESYQFTGTNSIQKSLF